MNLKKKAANEPGNNSQNVDIISQATLAGSELGFRDGYEYGFLNGFNNNSDDEEEHKAPEVPKFPEGKNPPTKKELEDFAQGYLDGYAEGKKVGSKDGSQAIEEDNRENEIEVTSKRKGYAHTHSIKKLTDFVDLSDMLTEQQGPQNIIEEAIKEDPEHEEQPEEIISNSKCKLIDYILVKIKIILNKCLRNTVNR